MGCGGSKFDSEAETVSARIRPLLLRRLEEMRSQRRINGASLKKSRTGTSKKELLKDGVSDCDTVSSPPHDFDGKSNLSQEDNQKVAPEEKTMPKNVEPDTKAVKDASMLKSMKVAPSPQRVR